MHARFPRVVGMVVGFTAVAVSLVLGSALGAQSGPRLTVAPAAGHTGQTVAVRGYGFRPEEHGFVFFGARRIGSFGAGARGAFLVRFAVPAGAHGRLRILAARYVRSRRGSRRLRRLAGARFLVVALGAGGGPGTGSGGVTGGPAGGSAGGGSTRGGSTGSGSTGGGSTGAKWIPAEHLTWYWQLQGTVSNSEPVAAYDIDGFENTAAEVTALHAEGIHVICYIDVGTYEPGRPDTSSFSAAVIGSEVQGWPGEKWLDVRQLSVLEPIMTKRFEMCKEKGFDAVEPDNMDGYANSIGFPITAAEQATYDEWVATEVHSLGMAVLQKNDGEQTAQLEPYFDGALDEECNVYDECSNFTPYLTAGKPVLNAEYGSANAFCAADNAAGIMGARFDLELDGKTFEPCW